MHCGVPVSFTNTPFFSNNKIPCFSNSFPPSASPCNKHPFSSASGKKQREMQQPGPMFPVMPSFPPTSITTEQIQKYLDENKKLILAILDNQNLGKLSECAQYQAQLQKNLMYLAAIADAQPQTPAMPTQMTVIHPAMAQGALYMQQPSIFPPRAPFISNPHPLQDPQLHQRQAQPHPQAQMALRPVGPTNNNVNSTQNDTKLGGGSSGGIPASNSGLNDIHGGNKKDKTIANLDGQGNAGVGGGADGEQAK